MVLPSSGDLLLTATSTTDFNQFEVDTNARYVKLIGYGRFNSAGDTRASVWSAVGEIEFYGGLTLSVDDLEFNKNVLVYPVPVKDNLNFKLLNHDVELVKVYNIKGQLILEKSVEVSNLDFSINLESISSGTYIVNLSGKYGLNVSKLIIVSD